MLDARAGPNSQLYALSKHDIPRDEIFGGKISTWVRVQPRFKEALRTAREVKAHAPRCRAVFTAYEMKRLGRDPAELAAFAAFADHLTTHGPVLEMLAGPLPGIHDPAGPGKLLFAFFAAMAEAGRENIRGPRLRARHRGTQVQARRPAAPSHHRQHAPHRAPAPRGRRVRRADPAQPDHLHRQAQGTGPLYRQHLPGARRTAKREAYPGTAERAHVGFAALQAGEAPGPRLTLPH
ncbi:recombinase family protein [Streptomyces sudanensis]|uniref:recombinase family protein n=1 Tax=Streptomyces sudanensis TaxID=436397 RepID=UPI0020CCA885|nr:recombinase family protein [Streptomyces sudanensis]MCP9985899.1 recombinase family protein [Streptomyces sudanensis]